MFFRFVLVLFVSAVFVFGVSGQSFAQEVAQGSNEGGASEEMDLEASQKNMLESKVASTMTSLDMQDAQHFTVLYSNYSIYSMVKAVREDVKNASMACAENNKDMADSVMDRFEQWDNTVSSTMNDANANIESMALAQSYMPQSEVKVLFGLVDEQRSKNSSRFETTPVTTPEACEFMMSKMDETEDSMVHMLRATLISFPLMLQKNQQ